MWCDRDGECTESFDVYDDNEDWQLDNDVASLSICVRGPADNDDTTDEVGAHRRRRPSSPGRHHFHHSSVGRRLTLVYRRLVPQLSNPDPAWIYFRFRRQRRRPSAADLTTAAAVKVISTTVHPVTSPADTFRLRSFILSVIYCLLEIHVVI